MNPSEIFSAAKNAAQSAAQEASLPTNARGFDCGLAWVVIKPARGQFVKFLKDMKVGYVRNYGGGGYEISYSTMHSIATQSVSVHRAAARAFADVLIENGIRAYSDSRLDLD